MKAKLSAGAELDLLNRDELEQVLRSWRIELTRGTRFRRLSIIGNVAADGTLMMGDVNDGPGEGMAWGITRISVAPGPTIPAGGLQVYANDATSPSGLMIRNLNTTDLFPGDHGCVLAMGDALRIAGTGLTVGAQIIVTMSIKEVPVQQIWQL